jgi:hypothetical protein
VKQNNQPREHNKIITFRLHRYKTKTCGNPTGNLESLSPTKSWSRPTRNKTQNNQPRELNEKTFPFAPLN